MAIASSAWGKLKIWLSTASSTIFLGDGSARASDKPVTTRVATATIRNIVLIAILPDDDYDDREVEAIQLEAELAAPYR
jgi:hypothetical protein